MSDAVNIALDETRRDARPTLPSNPFTAGYYLEGKTLGISNYENYRFMEPETQAYVSALTRHLGLLSTDRLHDIGCARGFLVKVLRMFGHEATGHDISEWAIENCHPDVKGFVSNSCEYLPKSVDWVHLKDCAEHWSEAELKETLPRIFAMARKGCFFIVPLVAYWNGAYIYPADNEDKTHLIRFRMDDWLKLMMEAAKETDGDFSIHGSYHMTGLKKASVDYPFSTGFITVRRFA